MRVETLYKTKTPEKDKSECYELVIGTVPGTSPRTFRFLEKHGWWDEESKTYVLSRTTIDTEQEAITLEEAETMFEAAKANRASNGFVHGFAPDYFGDGPYVYALIEA
jgi:hypothetical protein